MKSISSAILLTTESMISSVSSGHVGVFFFAYLAKLGAPENLPRPAHCLRGLGCAHGHPATLSA